MNRPRYGNGSAAGVGAETQSVVVSSALLNRKLQEPNPERGSATTFATYFLKNGNWYLNSWGSSYHDAMDVLNEAWLEQRRSGVDGIKLEPTPEVLKGIKTDESPKLKNQNE